MQRYYGEEGTSAPAPPPGKWGLTAEGRARRRPTLVVPVTDPGEDLNDELCRVCAQGVRPAAQRIEDWKTLHMQNPCAHLSVLTMSKPLASALWYPEADPAFGSGGPICLGFEMYLRRPIPSRATMYCPHVHNMVDPHISLI